MQKTKLAAAAMTVLISVGLGSVVAEAKAAKIKMEKCYGVVKAGKNSCSNSRHSCSAQAKQDSEPDEWIFLPKGTCEKIVGGSLTSNKAEDGAEEKDKG